MKEVYLLKVINNQETIDFYNSNINKKITEILDIDLDKLLMLE